MHYIDIEELALQGAFSHKPHLLYGVGEVTVAALGGLPPKLLPVSSREFILQRVGMGSLLTYGNRHGVSCVEYGERALATGEDWEANTVRVTFLLIRLTEASRFAFAADRRFHLSWQERRMKDVPLCLLADGSWKDWMKYSRFADDPSFPIEHRRLLQQVASCLAWLIQPVQVEGGGA